MLKNRSVPNPTVIPQLPYPSIGEATAWLTEAFGFTLRLGIGDHRAQLNAGDGAVILTHQPDGPIAPNAVMLRVEDAAACYARAVEKGARPVRSPADYPYGERQCTVADPAGHLWTFTQSIADVDPLDWGGTPGIL